MSPHNVWCWVSNLILGNHFVRRDFELDEDENVDPILILLWSSDEQVADIVKMGITNNALPNGFNILTGQLGMDIL